MYVCKLLTKRVKRIVIYTGLIPVATFIIIFFKMSC